MDINCRKILRQLIAVSLLLRPGHSAMAQSKIFSSECQVLSGFIASSETVAHFVYSQYPPDSGIRIVDVNKKLVRCGLKLFGAYPIIIDTSAAIIDTIKNKGIFDIRNRDINFLILSYTTRGKELYYSLYNPRTNADCSIKVTRMKKLWHAGKIKCGWF
ncbi:hypothetical protein [Ferruginibacter profundus]